MEPVNGKKPTGKQKQIQKSQWVTCFHQTSKFYLKVFIFQSSFRFTSKLSGGHRDFPHALHSHTDTAWPFPTLPPDGTFVTTGEPTWMQHDYPRSTVCLRLTVGVHSVGLNKEMVTCIHLHSIIQSIFTVPQIVCAPQNVNFLKNIF